MKTCTKCGALKPFSQFSKDKYKQDGHRSACKECNKQDHIRRYTADPNGCKNRSKEYRRNNPEKVKASNRNTKLKRNYGITYDDYVVMVNKQSNKCACCDKETDKLVVDHSHTTGQVRELLCHQCNTALGLLNEDVVVMQNMINYTRKHNGKV